MSDCPKCGGQHFGSYGCPFDKIADTVLAYRPKPKSKPAKKRARRKRKIQKRESSI